MPYSAVETSETLPVGNRCLSGFAAAPNCSRKAQPLTLECTWVFRTLAVLKESELEHDQR